MRPPPPQPPAPPVPTAMELALADDFQAGVVQVFEAFAPSQGSDAIAPTQTLTWVYRGPQVAGTLASLMITQPLTLVLVASTQPISFGRTMTVFPTAGFSSNFIGLAAAATSVGRWVGNVDFAPPDTLYVDSIGGLGSSDIAFFTFVLRI